jgi:hypothetical protein
MITPTRELIVVIETLAILATRITTRMAITLVDRADHLAVAPLFLATTAKTPMTPAYQVPRTRALVSRSSVTTLAPSFLTTRTGTKLAWFRTVGLSSIPT